MIIQNCTWGRLSEETKNVGSVEKLAYNIHGESQWEIVEDSRQIFT